MSQSPSFAVTRADIAWAITSVVLMAATFYYSGLSAGRREYTRESAKSLRSLLEEKVACEEALNAQRESHGGDYWIIESNDDGASFYIYWD
jgi:hypothetical protein